MSTFWHWFIVILSVGNIIACIWLLMWSSKQNADQVEEGETLEHCWDGDLQERNNPLPRWWLWLFIGSITWGFGYLIYYPGLGNYTGTSGWTQVGQYEQERERVDAIYHEKFSRLAAMDYEALSSDAEAMEIGSRLFGGNCATCHGSDARGAIGYPNLTDNDWLYGGTAESIEQTIINGRKGLMPGWKDAVGVEGVMELLAYVKSIARMAHNEKSVLAGKTRYMTTCIACHGRDGTGVQMLGGTNLTDDVWLYGKSDSEIIDSIAHGRSGEMPAHVNLLSAEEIKLLTAYVMSISRS